MSTVPDAPLTAADLRLAMELLRESEVKIVQVGPGLASRAPYLLSGNVTVNPHLPPDAIVRFDRRAVELQPLRAPVRFECYEEGPWPYGSVPEGHEPVFLLKPGDWLFDHDRVRLQGDLIKLFGTRPKAPRFTPRWPMCVMDPRRAAMIVNIGA